MATIAPGFSPSAVHADYPVPVKPACDAALALAMCRVIIDEGLYDAAFVKDQTDLPLLVRRDNHRSVANQVRFQLFILACNLGNFLRRAPLPPAVTERRSQGKVRS